MSFAGDSLGAVSDWGELLSRRLRRAVALVVVGWAVLSPDFFAAAAREVGERKAQEIVKQIPSLPTGTSTSPSPSITRSSSP